MKKLIFVSFLFILISSCNNDNSKILGYWNISNFTINDGNFYLNHLSTLDQNKAVSIKFLDNGFFLMKINVKHRDYNFISKQQETSNYDITWKGKWEVKSLAKIKLQFIDEISDIGLQKGTYNLSILNGSDQRLMIKTKGVNNFACLELYR